MTEKTHPTFRPDAFADEVKKIAQNNGQKMGQKKELPPVHLWNPDFCGDIDMHIKRDGSWDYMGTPIARLAMVRLFSTILRHDEDGKYYLVTPVEKVGIRVDDAPFVAVALEKEGEGKDQVLHFRTNVGDEFEMDENHPLRFKFSQTGEPSPYILVRGRLDALIARPVYYELAAMVVDHDGQYGVWSRGQFFSFGQDGLSCDEK